MIRKLVVLLLLVASSTFAQNKVTTAPTFHGVTFGVPSPLPMCTTITDEEAKKAAPEALCRISEVKSWMKDDSLTLVDGFVRDKLMDVNFLHGDHEDENGEYGQYIYTDKATKTVEAYHMVLAASESDRIYRQLRGKFGAGTCTRRSMRTGIGVPVAQTACVWRPVWGTVLFNNVDGDLDHMSVRAQTKTFIKKTAVKEKNEF